MKKPIILVMAAGMGSRYGGLKQIDPVGDHGEVILDFSLYDAMMAGFERAVLVIKKENEEAFREMIDEREGKRMEINYAFQELSDIPEGYDVPEGRVKPWGTAHAVYSAREYLDAPFAVINADDYYGPGAFQVMYDFLDGAKDGQVMNYAMVAFNIEKTLTENGTVARGVCEVSDDGMLESVTERTKIMWRGDTPAFTEDGGETWTDVAPGTPVSMNLWGFTPSMVDEIGRNFKPFLDDVLRTNPLKGEYMLPTVVSSLIEAGKAQVRVLHSHDKWYGVTYKEDRESVVNALQSMKDKGLYPDILWR
ncbi:MAG: sugar phosphate nucleotidyltransferase [Eubacteriales bacterium]|nr:sugar phosphate nucleotidyltransferase [Eubacteriales bacterium]